MVISARLLAPLLVAACTQDASLSAVLGESEKPAAEGEGAPDVAVVPELLDLGTVPIGTRASALVWVTSTGTAPTGESGDTADSGEPVDTPPCVLTSVAHLATAGSSQVAVDADYREIIAPAYDVGADAEVFDADTYASVSTFATGNRGNPVLVDAVANHIWVGNPDSGSVTIVERGTHAAVTTLRGFQNPHSIVQDPDTGTIYVGDHFAGSVSAFDPTTLDALGTLTLGYGITQMSIGDGRLYVPRTDGTLDVVDTATLSVLDTMTLASSLYGASVVAGTDRLFVAGFGAGTVYVIEASTLTMLGRTTIANPYQLRASADGTLVAVPGYGDGSLSLLDSTTGAIVVTASACVSATDVTEDTDSGGWVVTCGTRSGLEVLECR